MQITADSTLVAENQSKQPEFRWWAGNARFIDLSGRLLGAQVARLNCALGGCDDAV